MEHKSRQIGETILPLIIYYVVYNIAQFLLIFAYNAISGCTGSGLQEYMLAHTQTMTELVKGLSRIIGVLPLIPMLKKELAVYERTADCTSVFLTVMLAASVSLGFNILMTLTGFVQTSTAYQDVADRQFGLSFGTGLILFGLVSPIAEEIVFRGLIFNRIRRCYSTVTAVLASGVLFGVFHGNLVQGVYGGCMGILMAYAYERMYGFVIPCLFHMTANSIVYILAQNATVQGRLFTMLNGMILFIISVICIVLIEKRHRNYFLPDD